MDNPLTKLALDHWYQVLMVGGLVIFIMCGAGLLPNYPTAETALISIGVFFVGVGEWKNHPLQTRLVNSPDFGRGEITGYPRNNNAIGLLFLFFGIVLIAAGILNFIL